MPPKTAILFTIPITLILGLAWILVIVSFKIGLIKISSPWGVHDYSLIGPIQVASCPLFIHRCPYPFLAYYLQQLSLLSPLTYEPNSGQASTIKFGWFDLLRCFGQLFILGLLEKTFLIDRPTLHKAHLRFACLILLLSVCIFYFRTVLGIVSYHLGFTKICKFYSSRAFRETSKGLTPVLLAVALVLSSVASRKSSKLIIFCLVLLLIPMSSLFQDIIGVFVGLVASLGLKKFGVSLVGDYKTSRWILAIVLCALLISTNVAFIFLSTREKIDLSEVQSIGAPYAPLITFVVMSAPRPGGVDHLTHSIRSYLDAFPSNNTHPLHDRLRMMVFTHFTENEVFNKARTMFSKEAKGSHYLDWVQLEGNEINPKLHFCKAIEYAATQLTMDAHYIGIVEDDFPLCQNGFEGLLKLVLQAKRKVPSHCGLFIGTGGSGVIFRRSIYQEVIQSIRLSPYPVDVSMQRCLLGRSCLGCQLVIPEHILMYHTGHDSSSLGHMYSANKYQCGQRHPFVSEPDAILLN